MPHVFIILLFIMLFVVVLSYIIPSGSYQRLQDASGITVIDPNTFQYGENETPIGFMDYFEAIYTGFVNGATIMGKQEAKNFRSSAFFTRFSLYLAFWDMARLRSQSGSLWVMTEW